MMRIFALLALLITAAGSLTAQTTLPPCAERPTALSEPWIRVGFACLERVVDDASAGEFGYTALAAGGPGILYAARPLAGQVIRLIDEDGDGLPETPTVVGEGLTLPNSLTYHDGALYVAGGPHVHVLRDGSLTTLIDDLPMGEFWTGGVAVFDRRLYVAIGAACDSCDLNETTSEHGLLLSFALDGSDRRVEARGLRSPYGLAVHDGDLYVTDSAPDAAFDMPDLDEINRYLPGADFGFPDCLGRSACDGTMAPVVSLPTASLPTALASYTSDALPHLTGKLLLVLNGSRNQLELRGYRLVAADPSDGSITDIMPARPEDGPQADFTTDQMNFRGSGYYPHRPIGVTVTEQGWIYLSIGGGRILALRP
ncbi:MAG: PQQ-dependent sugar dehydrogenase [Chloroflexi bacterium]|nr:PQQ-dependent sugar dehydrogenase [Chloroflexota bacterium]